MNKLAFLFSGQGNQVVGMARDICVRYPVSMKIFEEADRILQKEIKRTCFEGPEELLNQTEYTQPCLLAAELAISKAFEAEKIIPDIVAGFSVGEWAALVVAGVIDEDVALKLVAIRAKATQDAVPLGSGAMATILNQSGTRVNELCNKAGGYIVPVNYNCPGKITVAGEKSSVDCLVEIGEKEEIPVIVLPITIASHCKLMEPAAKILQEALQNIEFRNAKIPIVMNVDGIPTRDAKAIKKNIESQLTQAVLFEKSLIAMEKLGVDLFFEVGAGRTLSSFVKATCSNARSLRTDTNTAFDKAVNEIISGR